MGATESRLSVALGDRYVVERQIGEGGMATVYLARDVRHERLVAIKVLRPELAARLGSERFLQEIKVTARLQHPNILPLYDSGAADEFLYYVMPYVDGESLRTKIDRERQMGLEETVVIARAVAGALDYAHEHGIVHRDIKPDNVLLQRGQPLVADFGIALAVSAAGGTRFTQTGLSIGTPHYMSPEQASGERDLDSRSDIYSLGAMTYEMLTGEPPHRATSTHAVIAKILSEKPSPITNSRELVPPNVDAAVQRALAKSPADRFARATHFADALINPGFRLPTSGQFEAADVSVLRVPPRWLWAALPAVLVAGALGGWMIRSSTDGGTDVRAGQPAVFHLQVDEGQAVPGYPAMSADGRMFVHPAGDAGANRLYRRRLDDPAAEVIPQTEGGQSAFLSPDGAWVGFLADQSLKRVRLDDGQEGVIAPYVEGLAGATWGEDDTIVLATMPNGALFRVSAKGGDVAPLAAGGEPRDSGFFFPHFLPGGKAIVFNDESTGGLMGVLDLETGTRCMVGRGLRPSYIESGYLVFANPEGRLSYQPFSLSRLDTTGAPALLPEYLGVGRGRAFYSVSRNGSLVIIRSAGTYLDVTMIDRTGKQQVLIRDAGWTPRFSPNGNSIAFGDVNPDDVWIYDLTAHSRRRLTLDGTANSDPAWSPDGRQLAMSSDKASRKDVLIRNADGSGSERQLVTQEGLQWPSDWTRTGYVVFTDVPLDEDRDIWAAKADGSEPPFRYLDTPFLEKGCTVSADGRWIAYDSNAPGRFEVFVNRFPTPLPAAIPVSRGGGRNPRWSPDGQVLYYWRDRDLVAARMDLRETARIQSSSTVLQADYAGADHPNYDVHPDGQRFVVLTGRARPQRLTVALGAFPQVAR